MITEYMEDAFDTELPEFEEMTKIIGPAMFRKKFEGAELHHIVPVTYFAQNDEDRPTWATIANWGSLIRNSPEHPANQEWNLVYLTKDEHNRVHELMAKINGEEWKAPSKGCNRMEAGKIYTIDRDKYRNKVFIRKEDTGYTLLPGITLSCPASCYIRKGFDLYEEYWNKEIDCELFVSALWKVEVLIRGSDYGSNVWIEYNPEDTQG